jgi:hypothetical protein
MMRMLLENRVQAGGAMARLLSGQAPEWHCLGCGNEWRGGLFVGGHGNSVGDAVVIQGIASTAIGVRAEKQYLTEKFGLSFDVAVPPIGWKLQRQTLLGSNGSSFDMITILLVDGTERTVYFDVSCFYGRKP